MLNSNLIRKKIKQTNVTSLNKNILIYELKILKNLIHSLRKKKIIVSESIIFLLYNKIYINLKVYYEHSKIKKYKKMYKEKSFLLRRYKKKEEKRKRRRKKRLLKLGKIKIKKKVYKYKPRASYRKKIHSRWSLTKFFLKAISSNKKSNFKNNVIISVTNLNLQVNVKLYRLIRMNLKKRGYYRFFHISHKRYKDFLLITALFLQDRFSLKAYLNVLGRVFRTVSKKRHKAYFKFLSHLAAIFVSLSNYLACSKAIDKKKIYKRKSISGVRFIISGKIKGKRRSSVLKITEKGINFNGYENFTTMEKTTVFTRYGTFGIKLFITHKNNLTELWTNFFYNYAIYSQKNKIQKKQKRKKLKFNK